MTRRCRIGCNNLRGDTDVVCRACWACLPFAMRQEVADARIGTLAARVAARRVYEWLAAQQTAPVVVMGVELPDAGHRDEVRARAEASFDALAKGARDVPCSGPCSESARCGACLAHANQAGLGRMLERTQNQRDAWAARFASLRARVEGLPWARRGSGADITGAVEKNDVLALLDKEPA